MAADAGSDEGLLWQVWVSSPLNKDAEMLTRWSRTSFFGGRPVSPVMVEGGKEYVLFRKCCEESTMKIALATALSNYSHVLVIRRGAIVPLDAYVKDIGQKREGLLGDAATMERTGGMC